MTQSQGFPPVSAPDAQLLILGSMPGVASLKATQYYAFPRNAFWRIMGELFGAGPELEYQARLDKLALGVSIALPGAAGVLSRRPLHSLLGALLFAIAVGALIWRQGVFADPLVAGAAGPFAFLCVSVLAGISYAIVVGTSLAARRSL